MDFEWDGNKNAVNIAKHGLELRLGALVFDDPMRVTFVDRRKDYGETRMIAIGQVLNGIITVVYTLRGDVVRLISARAASKKEREVYLGNS